LAFHAVEKSGIGSVAVGRGVAMGLNSYALTALELKTKGLSKDWGWKPKFVLSG